MNVDVFSIALAHFAEAVSAGKGKRIVVVIERAGWHVSQALTIPHGVHLGFLPPYSPALQPAERLCPLTNEAIANRQFETIAQLQETQARRGVTLQDDPVQIRAAPCYHWWPMARLGNVSYQTRLTPDRSLPLHGQFVRQLIFSRPHTPRSSQ